MPRKKSRKVSSLSYHLQKTSLKIATYSPSPLLIAAVVIGISIFLLGGGIYDILMEPLALIPLESGRFLSYIPYRLHDQLLTGSLGVMILYAIGALGLLSIYYSTRYIRNPSQVSLLSIIGVAMLLVAFISVEAIIYWILNYPSS